MTKKMHYNEIYGIITKISNAINEGDIKLALQLIDENEEVVAYYCNQPDSPQFWGGYNNNQTEHSNPLIAAINNNDHEVITKLVDRGVNLKLSTLFTVHACSYNHVYSKTLDLLVKLGAPVNYLTDANFPSPLMFAALNGNLLKINSLLENGADPFFKYYLEDTKVDLVSFILEELEDEKKCAKTIKFLLKTLGNEIITYDNFTIAIKENQIPVVELFLANGAKKFFTNYNNNANYIPPVIYAHSMQMLKLLEKHGAQLTEISTAFVDNDPRTVSALMGVCSTGDIDFIKEVLLKFPKNFFKKISGLEQGVITATITQPNHEAINFLISQGFSLDATNPENGRTALAELIADVDLLVHYQNKINPQLLDRAVGNQDFSIDGVRQGTELFMLKIREIIMLLAHGANIRAPDYKGKTVIDYAREQNFTLTQEILKVAELADYYGYHSPNAVPMLKFANKNYEKLFYDRLEALRAGKTIKLEEETTTTVEILLDINSAASKKCSTLEYIGLTPLVGYEEEV